MTDFKNSESGAVTVDWVVLTAGLVGLGLATMGVVSSGVEDLSEDVDAELSGSFVATSFAAMNHLDYFKAVNAAFGLRPNDVPIPDTGEFRTRRYSNFIDANSGAELAQHWVDYYTNGSDQALINAIAYYDALVPAQAIEVATGQQLDPSTATAAQLGAAYGLSETTVQADLDAGVFDDAAHMIAFHNAYHDASEVYLADIKSLADERGLTY